MDEDSKFLVELKEQVEKLHGLLIQDERGLFTWWSFLWLRLEAIEELVKQVRTQGRNTRQ